MWEYKDELKLWMVKRNSVHAEYYMDTHAFCSQTRVDLTELSVTPFHNPTHNSTAFELKLFLERQFREKFVGTKTIESLIRTDKDVLDLRTNEPMKIVLWPTTKQLNEIPIPLRIHEGYMEKMEFHMYDDATTIDSIKFEEDVLRLSDTKDLMRFSERDIHTLASHQII